MGRRSFFIAFFALLVVATVWYASAVMVLPEYTFAKATQVADSVKTVMVPGTVLDREIVPNGATLTFYMSDADGTESKIFYDGQEGVPSEKLAEAKANRRLISVSGHVCGDRFHAKGIIFQ